MATQELRLAVSLVVAGSLICVSGSSPRAQEGFTSIFNGTDLTGWIADRTTVEVHAGVLAVHPGIGWLRLDKVLSNFVLRMEVRLVEPGAKAGIFVRSWPTFDQELNVPNNGYRIVAAGNSTGVEAAGRMMGHGRDARQRFNPAGVDAAMEQQDTWHRYEIECVGNTLRVVLDGRLVNEVIEIQNPQGFIALRTDAGVVEFRNVTVREIQTAKPTAGKGVFTVTPGGDIVSPKLRSEVKPQYTREAMARKIQGEVLLSAVVQPDATVTDFTVLQSLDPEFGLDDEVLNAARRWQFAPGTRDGKPVPVLITIAISMTLR